MEGRKGTTWSKPLQLSQCSQDISHEEDAKSPFRSDKEATCGADWKKDDEGEEEVEA